MEIFVSSEVEAIKVLLLIDPINIFYALSIECSETKVLIRGNYINKLRQHLADNKLGDAKCTWEMIYIQENKICIHGRKIWSVNFCITVDVIFEEKWQNSNNNIR